MAYFNCFGVLELYLNFFLKHGFFIIFCVWFFKTFSLYFTERKSSSMNENVCEKLIRKFLKSDQNISVWDINVFIALFFYRKMKSYRNRHVSEAASEKPRGGGVAILLPSFLVIFCLVTFCLVTFCLVTFCLVTFCLVTFCLCNSLPGNIFLR